MTWEETNKDMGAYQQALDAQTSSGADSRVAEGRARRAAVRAYRSEHPEEEAAHAAQARTAAPAGAAAAAGAAPAAAAAASGNGGSVAVAAAPMTAAVREAPLPTGNIPTPKKGAPDKHRLLAIVPPEGIQRVEREQGDRVHTWPHLLIEEFIAMAILFAGMLIFSSLINAPLRELANPNLTPNPSKAPWYFLGLQELLRYFHPMVAGIVIPTFILVGLAAVPYVDRNPSIKPGDRKVAITLFTILFMFGAILTIIGSFFRGPGYNWVWPWTQGVFFEL
ncbi:MAG TPA: menaquinol-cytochrome c reductase cytochrome b subunit [Actinomycetota bacterium]|jgi:menaquinol-cytochrome c reductase cytochrome b/c subunit|nr:menaquinol-cytochrome c reductase cytochrome b subunit [Actinomycetota bacterium]